MCFERPLFSRESNIIESYRALPPLPLDLYYMPYSHSLLSVTIWSALVFAGYRWMVSGSGSRRGRPALFLALAVFSHWVLDLVVHRPDLPLYHNARKVGLGLWNYPLTAFALEAALLVGGILRRKLGCGRRRIDIVSVYPQRLVPR